MLLRRALLYICSAAWKQLGNSRCQQDSMGNQVRVRLARFVKRSSSIDFCADFAADLRGLVTNKIWPNYGTAMKRKFISIRNKWICCELKFSMFEQSRAEGEQFLISVQFITASKKKFTNKRYEMLYTVTTKLWFLGKIVLKHYVHWKTFFQKLFWGENSCK